MSLRIGTRSSPLALWQANEVKNRLEAIGQRTRLVPITSDGDQDQNRPLHELGNIGIFTKALDDALLQNRIDIAVHSCKDLPTVVEEGLQISATLPRGDHRDVLVPSGDVQFLEDVNSMAVIATGSIRRRAQWLNRYPHHRLENIRGNVDTRLKKARNQGWHGAIFAKAGLDRLNLQPANMLVLDWMIPAPAQGIVAIVSRTEDKQIHAALQSVGDSTSFMQATCERSFMNRLEGGCSAPIGAYANVNNGIIHLVGVLLQKDGSEKVNIELSARINEYAQLGLSAADQVLKSGGNHIMDKLREDA